jgi:hypothetical protein
MWTIGIQHGVQNNVPMEFSYIPHVHILEFLKCESRDMAPPVEWKKH